MVGLQDSPPLQQIGEVAGVEQVPRLGVERHRAVAVAVGGARRPELRDQGGVEGGVRRAAAVEVGEPAGEARASR